MDLKVDQLSLNLGQYYLSNDKENIHIFSKTNDIAIGDKSLDNEDPILDKKTNSKLSQTSKPIAAKPKNQINEKQPIIAQSRQNKFN